MSETEPLAREDESCPKRLWVLTTLSDDEQLDENGTLPPGLQFHLSRCESCRALADRLLLVTKAVRELGDLEPAGDLGACADHQALSALGTGAKLTGRVDIPEIEDLEPAKSGHSNWRIYLPYAAAAAVLIAASAFWASQFGRRPDQLASGPPSAPGTPFAIEPPPNQTPETRPPPPGVAPQLPEGNGEKRLAGTEPQEPARRPRRTVCSYHSHIEAAECEDDTCIHRAVILPDPAQRTLGWGGVFDRKAPVESTRYLRNDE